MFRDTCRRFLVRVRLLYKLQDRIVQRMAHLREPRDHRDALPKGVISAQVSTTQPSEVWLSQLGEEATSESSRSKMALFPVELALLDTTLSVSHSKATIGKPLPYQHGRHSH